MLALQAVDLGDPGTDCGQAATEAIHDALKHLAPDAATSDAAIHDADADVLYVVAHSLDCRPKHVDSESAVAGDVE